MNSEYIIVDVQGFKDLQNNFIIKEFALATQEYTQVFLIKPPYHYSYLGPEEKRQVSWLERNRGILWREGHFNYSEFKCFIKIYLKNKRILLKGTEKVKWIADLTKNCNIIDIEDRGCPNFPTLHRLYCKNSQNFNCFNHTQTCALKNVICIKKWYDSNMQHFSN